MTLRLHVTGLDHIVLRCADVERSLSFYRDTLGLEPERLDEWRRGEVPFPSVRISPTTIIDLFAAARDGVNMDHVCLVIEPTDLDELAAAFPGSTRGDGLYGAQGYASSVYISDPDGNTVELRSYAAVGSG
ncbi:MAG TPA: VOC family protein [Ilumatobacteraceae bacterium]|nr:VOC family protein [Ilumatobacteraceae bacterium]